MTYEEYKNNKSIKSNKKVIKNILNKFFTITIFTIFVVTISNYSSTFRDFIINEVLNSTFDFSFMNKITSRITSLFEEEDKKVSLDISEKYEKYKDGIKYYINDENIYLKDSGIVTFIGEKEEYGKVIMIQQSNGYYALYGNIKPSVKLYDYVTNNTIIGTSQEYYYYVLYKDDKPIDILNEN